jgi:predicted XRE-type DNA-binding protein
MSETVCMGALYDNRIGFAMPNTILGLDAINEAAHSHEMRSEAEIREALRAKIAAKAITQTDVAKVLGVQQPNAATIFTPARNGKLRRISYDEGLKLIEHFQLDGSGAAPRVSEDALARLLHALGPSIPKGDLSESAARALAVALSYALELLQETGANDPTDREVALAAHAAATRFREVLHS